MIRGQVKRVCLIFLVLSCALPCVADELQSSLKHAYQGKAFVIRNFWSGTVLNFDAAGQLKGDADPGSWTLDGLVRIERVSIEGTRLRLKCKRLVMIGLADELDYQDRHENPKLEINVEIGSGSHDHEAIEAALSKIFVTDEVTFRDSVAPFWRECISTAISGFEKASIGGCRFSARLRDILSSRTTQYILVPQQPENASGAPPPPTPAEAALPNLPFYKVGNGITKPKPLYLPSPIYTEEARIAKFQGVCILSIVVSSSGSPKNIQVARPLGYGLDDQAVAAVEKWKFEPAMKDGQPVEVKTEVEVSFHLY